MSTILPESEVQERVNTFLECMGESGASGGSVEYSTSIPYQVMTKLHEQHGYWFIYQMGGGHNLDFTNIKPVHVRQELMDKIAAITNDGKYITENEIGEKFFSEDEVMYLHTKYPSGCWRPFSSGLRESGDVYKYIGMHFAKCIEHLGHEPERN